MRKELGTLLVVGGAALVWLLKKHLHGPRIHERFITLTSKAGRCGIQGRQQDIPPVELSRRRGDQVHWIIRNPQGSGSACNHGPRVCIGEWRLNRQPTESPVRDLQNGNLCRTVPQPSNRPIPARVDPDAREGDYSYSVLIDGDVAIDPMVRIVV